MCCAMTRTRGCGGMSQINLQLGRVFRYIAAGRLSEPVLQLLPARHNDPTHPNADYPNADYPDAGQYNAGQHDAPHEYRQHDCRSIQGKPQSAHGVAATPSSLYHKHTMLRRIVPLGGLPLLMLMLFGAAHASDAEQAPGALPTLSMGGLAFDDAAGDNKPDDIIDWRAMGPIQFTRSDPTADEVVSTQPKAPRDIETSLSFKLSPGKFEFSRSGAFGLGGVFANPEIAVVSKLSGRYSPEESVPSIYSGLSYSADVRIEHEDEDINGTAYVSSSQLGLSYGRLGRVWYSGLDVRLGQFNNDSPIRDASEVLSFDLTTGRRMKWTGEGAYDPLWLFSIRGNFDVQSSFDETDLAEKGEWSLNPSLFWQNPGFTFAAQLEVPMDSDLLDSPEEPDYRLRAVFEKQF